MKEGDRLDARYRLDAILGHGGMGVIYRGFDERLERPVAIKVLAADHGRAPAARERFLREARRTAQLHHPHLVEVFDIGEATDGELFFVMELLSGELLSERMARVGAFDIAAFRGISLPICDAVGAAHAADVVHRDLKPENVMLGPDGPKVLDFGIFKEAGSTTKLTDVGSFVGTVGYAAPEQIRGEPLDVRADVYALGVTFYELLAGAPLFDTTNVAALLHHHLSVAPTPLRERAPSVSAAVASVVMRCLAKAPELRWTSASALGVALRAALEQGTASTPSVTSAPTIYDEVDDPEAPALQLELDVQSPPPAPFECAAPLVPVSAFHGASPTFAMRIAPPPSFLVPFGVLPVNISKRVATYSCLVALLARVFFHASLVTTGAFLMLGLVAGLGWWVRSRTDAREGLDDQE